MYRNYFYREDLKVELTQLEEEDEKERFLEGSKHKRLIPGYVALEVKENTCKISPVLYPEFRGKGYWKDAENFCWKESLKKDLSCIEKMIYKLKNNLKTTQATCFEKDFREIFKTLRKYKDE